MKKRNAFVLSAKISAAFSAAVLASILGIVASRLPSKASVPGRSDAPQSALLCKVTGPNCASPDPVPYGYLLSLPIGSAITNETELLQSIPGGLYVSKYSGTDNTILRWNGTNCCKASRIPIGGVTTNCHPTGPGGCFSVVAGEGFGVAVTAPGRYTILGTDGSTFIPLVGPVAPNGLGQNLISLPFCSPIADAKSLMDNIGFASVASVSKYLSPTDTLQVYTGRKGGGTAFALVPGEAYFVKMLAPMSYPTSYSPGCAPSECTGCGPNGADCDDGNACTSGSHCSGGNCVGGTSTNCDDNDPLTEDSCIGCTGACVNYTNPCSQPPVNGTINLPPVGCDYVSATDVHVIRDGLPPGTEVHYAAIHGGFTEITPLVSLRGTSTTATTETFDSDLAMHVTGTGLLANVDCNLTLSPLHAVIESQPAQPGSPEQDFNTDMKSLTGELTSDSSCNLFESLKVTAGTDHGLPSPGHVHLHLRTDGFYDVASSFSVNVTMEFVGKGQLEGMSGSTTQIVEMGPTTTIVGGSTVIASVAPQTQILPPGSSYSVSAFVSDITGHALANQHVTFVVNSGPNAGVTGSCSANPSCSTDASGRVSFSYTSNGVSGTDQLDVCPDAGSCSPATVQWACTTNPPNSPTEVNNHVRLAQSGGTTQINWDIASGSTRSDVLRGELSGLPVGPGLGDEICLADDLPIATPMLTDNDDPQSGTGFWYLVRGGNVCGNGPYGFQVQNGVSTARASTTCP